MNDETMNHIDRMLTHFLRKIVYLILAFFAIMGLAVALTTGAKKLHTRQQQKAARLGEIEKIIRKHDADLKVIVKGLNQTMQRCDKNETAVQHLLKRNAG